MQKADDLLKVSLGRRMTEGAGGSKEEAKFGCGPLETSLSLISWAVPKAKLQHNFSPT